MARRNPRNATRPIGFSTGSLAFGNYAAALESISTSDSTAVELSALRETELPLLMRDLPNLRLERFQHVSIHAPSSLSQFDERGLVAALSPALDANRPIVVHADLIRTLGIWKPLGSLLYIENMDKRKRSGRTVAEMWPLLTQLPKARLCLDLAHARQIDPSLCEIVSFLVEFGDRLGQIHMSELNSQSRHEAPSHGAVAAIRSISRLISRDTPVILEYAAQPHELNNHLKLAQGILQPQPVLVRNVG